MASTLSKRHQARNEKALQELIKSVPGNDRCADCSARNPGWASWSLGIFLCMRCAALHRKLGTHISKVKSLSMDSWSAEQVENMKRTGNVISNQIFNPHNTKPRVPADADEVDSAIERFIRQKYEQKAYAEGAAPVRQQAAIQTYTGTSNGSRDTDDKPPTPPPKPGNTKPSKRFFGLRSVSSALPLSRNKESSRRSSAGTGKMFGATIGVTNDGMQWKLVTLKEMGFPDEQRNSSVLKGVNGDLDRAVESLVRLGEGNGSTGVRTPASSHFPSRQNSSPTNESRFSKPAAGPSMGASVQKPASQTTKPTSSNFPSQSLSSPSSPSYNPFDNIQPSSTQQAGLNDAMQNLNLGLTQQTQPQPLFPNTTGGYPANQDPWQQMRFQQSMTPPPVPQVPQHFNHTNPYAQHQQHNYNPFLINQQVQSHMTGNNPFLAQQQSGGSSNPFFNQQANTINSVFTQPFSAQDQQNQQTSLQQQQQQLQHQQLLQQQQQNQQQMAQPQLQSVQQPWMNQSLQNSPTQYSNPQQFPPTGQQSFNTGSMTYPGLQQQQQQQQQQQYQYQQAQPLSAQPTGRFDKSSILALYNYPQLAPQQQPDQAQLQETDNKDTTSQTTSPQPQAAKLPQGYSSGSRSATMPVSGSKNPFARPAIPQMSAVAEDAKHSHRDSMDGRHSPDAFASLSARFVR